MNRIIMTLSVIFLVLSVNHSIYAEETVFQEGEHCLAYRTEKAMFFVAEVGVIGKSCQVDSKLFWSDEKGEVRFEVSVPIRTLDSDNGKRDEHVAEILKAHQYPSIHFTTQFITIEEVNQALKNGQISLPGNLEIAGKSFAVMFPVQLSKQRQNLVIEGKLVTSFSDLELQIPSVGPGGMIAEPKDYLEILVQLDAGQILGMEELMNSNLVSQQ